MAAENGSTKTDFILRKSTRQPGAELPLFQGAPQWGAQSWLLQLFLILSFTLPFTTLLWNSSSVDLSSYCVIQLSSVAQSCLTLCDPMDFSMPGLPVLHHLPELAQTHVHWVSDAIQPSHPLLSLLLLPSIFPSIRVFSSESVLWIRWPKYWSFSHVIKRHLLLGRKAVTNLDSILKIRDIILLTKVHIVKPWFFQESCAAMRVRP